MIRRSVLQFVALLATAAGTGILATAPAAAAELVREFRETFDAREVSILHLKHQDGEVRIVPWDRDEIEVAVRYRLSYTRFGWKEPPYFDVTFVRRGSIVDVIDREAEPRGFALGYYDSEHLEHVYEVHAPAHLNLDLDGDDGLVSIEGWRGEIDITSDNGDIKLYAIDSPRTLVKVADGDVEIDGLRGELTLYGQDPDVFLFELDSERCRIDVEDGTVNLDGGRGRLDLESEDGDFFVRGFAPVAVTAYSDRGRIELALVPREPFEIDLGTERGNLVVEVDPGASFSFDLATLRGRVTIGLSGLEPPAANARRAAGQTAGDPPRGSLRIRSEGGDVTLRETAPASED